MVFFFTSLADPSYTIFAGKNKDENEILLRYCWPEDVWFHVDDYSSPHVYLRLKQGQTIEDIPKPVLIECCQLCKSGSIKGNKLDDITIIYTMFGNLRKEPQMEAGEVGFHDEKAVKKMKVATRNGPLLRKLEKTRVEKFPDLRQQREDRDAEEARKVEHERSEGKKKEAQLKKELKSKSMEEAAKREYRDLFANDNARAYSETKQKTIEELEEDFF